MTTPLPTGTPIPLQAHGEVIVHVFGRTDVGRTREHNEDAFVVADLTTGNATLQPEVRTHATGPRGSLFMVADGMGGAAAGEIASAMAIEIVIRELQARWVSASTGGPEAFAAALREATATTNTEIHAFALKHPEYRGMGTTATIAGLLGDTLYLAQVGDSRGYLVRNGEARQITKDQSLIQKLIEAGELTEEEAAVSDRRNIILQALGPEAQVRVDLTHQPVRRGDVLVLCSDGLSGQVTREQIAAVVTAHDDLMAACKALIDMANAAGGPDNITVILARFEGSGLAAAETGDEVGHRVYTGSGRVMARTVEMSAVDPDADTAEIPAAGSAGAGSMRATVPTPVAAIEEAEATAANESARRTSPVASPAVASSPPTGAAEPGHGDAGSGARRMTAGAMVDAAGAVIPRGRGRVIAGLLLVALIAFGSWWVWHTARKVVPRDDAPAAPATGNPSPTTP